MKLYLYVAQQFQMLEGKQVLSIGLFTDRVVLVGVPPDFQPSAAVPVGIPISFIACLTDVDKAESVTVYPEVVKPDGEVNSKQVVSPTRMNLVPGKGHNIVLKFDPLLVDGPGIHHVRLRFEDGRVLSESFELRFNPTEGLQVQTVQIGSPKLAKSDTAAPNRA
jgi:hypothetical protein